MKRKPKNVAELGSDIVSAYHELRNNKLRVAEAKQIANLAGKAINTVKAQLEFAKINKTKASKEILEFVKIDE